MRMIFDVSQKRWDNLRKTTNIYGSNCFWFSRFLLSAVATFFLKWLVSDNWQVNTLAHTFHCDGCVMLHKKERKKNICRSHIACENGAAKMVCRHYLVEQQIWNQTKQTKCTEKNDVWFYIGAPKIAAANFEKRYLEFKFVLVCVQLGYSDR